YQHSAYFISHSSGGSGTSSFLFTFVFTFCLHDALPICRWQDAEANQRGPCRAHRAFRCRPESAQIRRCRHAPRSRQGGVARAPRSEEHTSELQSRENLVCRLLLEKKKNPVQHCLTAVIP